MGMNGVTLEASSNWNPAEIAWCAALYEGEGTITIQHYPSGKVSLRITMKSCDLDTLEHFVQYAHMGTISGPYDRYGRKLIWQLNISSYERVQALVAAMWPWLNRRRKWDAYEAIRYARENWWEHRLARSAGV